MRFVSPFLTTRRVLVRIGSGAPEFALFDRAKRARRQVQSCHSQPSNCSSPPVSTRWATPVDRGDSRFLNTTGATSLGGSRRSSNIGVGFVRPRHWKAGGAARGLVVKVDVAGTRNPEAGGELSAEAQVPESYKLRETSDSRSSQIDVR